MPSDESPKTYRAHLFVCTNAKDKGSCCATRGGAELRDRLKKLAKDPAQGIGPGVRINQSGCLGRCEEGITAVLYPEGRWFTGLKPDDESVEKLLDAVRARLK